MNLSKRSFLHALAILPLAFACNGETVTDTDPVDPDTGTEAPDYFEVEAFFVDGRFAYDPGTPAGEGTEATAPVIRQYSAPDGTMIGANVTLTLQSFEGDQCEMLWVTNSIIPVGDWIADANTENSTAYTGFTLDSAANFGTDCEDLEFNPDTFGSTADFIARMQSYTWGLGIGPIDSRVEDALEEQVRGQQDGDDTWTEEFEGKLIGGGFWLDTGTAAAYFDGNWAFGVALDDDFVLEFDDANSNGELDDDEDVAEILPADISEDSIPRGVYLLSAAFGPFADGVIDLSAAGTE